MSSLIKTFKNNKLFHHSKIEKLKIEKPKIEKLKIDKSKNIINEIRFTKVLTKYSTEYNNQIFIHRLCQQLGMDKKDLISFFFQLNLKYDENIINNILENYDISKLDINRINRYIEKYTKENVSEIDDSLSINSILDLNQIQNEMEI